MNTQILTRAATVTEVTGHAVDVSSIKGHLVRIVSYDEQYDTFEVQVDDASPSAGQRSLMPACLLPYLIRECGEPDEFIGRAFLLSL